MWAVVALVLVQVEPVTLEAAVERALREQPSLAVARARVQAIALEPGVARAAWLPRLGVMAQVVVATTNNSTATVIGAPVVDLPRIGATPIDATASWAPAGSTTAALGVRQQVFDFGRASADAAAAEARVAAEHERLRVGEAELRALVNTAWFAVKAARSIDEASRAALARAEVSTAFVRAGVQSNLRAPIELTRAGVELERARLASLRSASALEIAQRQLGAAVGVRGPLDVAGDAALPVLPEREAFVAAVSASPRVKEARARADAQRAAVDAAKSQLLPSVFATAALSGRAGGATPNAGAVPWGAGWLPVVPNWDVGVLVQWQAFDGVALERAGLADAQHTVARAEGAAVEEAEVSAADVAWSEASLAVRAVPVLEATLAAAVASQTQATARFELGLASQLELIEAERVRVDAETQLALGRFAAARSVALLARFQPVSERR
jgi:outer membrane protein TolC